MAIIDRIPLPVFIVAAVLFGLAPFLSVPHLWEKLVMLSQGELRSTIDIFDLFLHGGPVLLVIWKLKRMYRPKLDHLPEDSIDQ